MKHLNTKLCLALAIILNAGFAIAQDNLPPVHIENATSIANKGAGSGSRLFAQSHYTANFSTPAALIPYDSQRFVYPNATTNLQNQKLEFQYGTAWVPTRKTDYTYNNGGKLTYAAYQNWTTASSSFTPSGQSFYFLNAAGYCTKDSNQVWLTATSTYRNNVRNYYTLNSSGKVTDQIYQNWDNGSNNLINYFHITNTYNAQGNLTQQTLQDWDASIHWMDYSRSTYAYDAGGAKVQTITGEQRIGSTPGLQTVYQNVYTNNAAGSPITILSNLWSSSTSSYKPSSRSIYTYDAAGNNITSTDEQWDVATSAYKPSDQYVYTYNTFNQMTSSTRLFWNGTAYALSSNSNRYNYYYEPYTTTTTGILATSAALKAMVYPTLCNSRLFVETEEAGSTSYLITSLNGASIVSGILKQGTNAIEVNDLAAGMYLLQIRSVESKGIYRFVKQ